MDREDWKDVRCFIIALLLIALLLLLHFLTPDPQPIFQNISNNI